MQQQYDQNFINASKQEKYSNYNEEKEIKDTLPIDISSSMQSHINGGMATDAGNGKMVPPQKRVPATPVGRSVPNGKKLTKTTKKNSETSGSVDHELVHSEIKGNKGNGTKEKSGKTNTVAFAKQNKTSRTAEGGSLVAKQESLNFKAVEVSSRGKKETKELDRNGQDITDEVSSLREGPEEINSGELNKQRSADEDLELLTKEDTPTIGTATGEEGQGELLNSIQKSPSPSWKGRNLKIYVLLLLFYFCYREEGHVFPSGYQERMVSKHFILIDGMSFLTLPFFKSTEGLCTKQIVYGKSSAY